MKILLNIARIIVGVLFIFSGLVKANDPLGLSYKMQEFFEVWGWFFLEPYTLAFSVLMISFEIIAGVAVLVGWKMNLFSWLLLLLIIFFTFLTGYAVFSGKIKECGCFGDCIPLTADQSFIKDLILLLLIGFIFANRKKIKPLFSTRNNILVLFFSTIFSFAFQWFVLLHLPIVDCLPYKAGHNIPEKMKVPPGAVPDSTTISFVYKVNGKEVEFGSDNFPDDFDDSTYKFVKRYDKLIRKGNAEVPIKDFSLTTVYGNDTTDAIMQKEGYTILLFVKNGYEKGNWLGVLSAINKTAEQKKIDGIIVTNISIESLRDGASEEFHAFTPVLCDAVAIKTAARTNPTLYLLKKGTIIGKWSYADFDRVLLKLQNLP